MNRPRDEELPDLDDLDEAFQVQDDDTLLHDIVLPTTEPYFEG